MEEIRIGLFGLLVANAVLGFLFGTFPLVAGLFSGNRRYGFLGFVVTVAGGAVLGVFLSYPLAMLFLWLIVRNKTVQPSGEEVAPVSDPEAEPDTI